MKKSTVLAFVCVIIAFLIVVTLGDKKVIYEKQTTFKTPEEAIVNFIGYANVSETFKVENGFFERHSRKFLDSISRRYRLYVGDDRWNNINFTIPQLLNYELTEVAEDNIKLIAEEYKNSLKGIPNYIKPKDIRFFSLEGIGIHSRDGNISPKEDGTFENVFEEEEIPVALYIVVVNEGEGYVVDYYTTM